MKIVDRQQKVTITATEDEIREHLKELGYEWDEFRTITGQSLGKLNFELTRFDTDRIDDHGIRSYRQIEADAVVGTLMETRRASLFDDETAIKIEEYTFGPATRTLTVDVLLTPISDEDDEDAEE